MTEAEELMDQLVALRRELHTVLAPRSGRRLRPLVSRLEVLAREAGGRDAVKLMMTSGIPVWLARDISDDTTWLYDQRPIVCRSGDYGPADNSTCMSFCLAFPGLKPGDVRRAAIIPLIEQSYA